MRGIDLHMDELNLLATGVGEGTSQSTGARRFVLEQNYPNPFNPLTIIKYTIAGGREQGSGITAVKLVVYDLLGMEVAVLVNERKTQGSYDVAFDASGLASGVYVYCLSAGSNLESRKMVLLK
jgi:hypothetical protein